MREIGNKVGRDVDTVGREALASHNALCRAKQYRLRDCFTVEGMVGFPAGASCLAEPSHIGDEVFLEAAADDVR